MEKIYFLLDILKNKKIVKNIKQIEYVNSAVSFDIETSSFMYNNEYCSCMYAWGFAVDNEYIIGRTWNEFIYLMKFLSENLGLHKGRRLIIYVHNLSYEFQFIRKYFNWEKVFALKSRKVCYALCDLGIEFRCSYILSNLSLENVAKKLINHKIKKLVGDLDYTLLRHSKTKLTEKEIGYLINDVLIVTAYINECIETEKNITNIPLTNTGYVRRYIKRNTDKKYRDYISTLTLEVDEYKMLKRAFQGGFTHASSLHSGKIENNVSSYDLKSSYPAVMVSEYFPISKGRKVVINNLEEFKYYIDNFCCLFNIQFFDLTPKIYYENIISYSKCSKIEKFVLNNGRVFSAEMLETTITELDFKSIEKFYNFSKIKIGTFYIYRKGYLPKVFVSSILKLFEDKTKLDGVEGQEAYYMASKNMLNSAYGMSVTDIVRDDIIYSYDEWSNETKDLEEEIAKYNKKKGRFLFYPWGVWVTAHARYRLFTAISEFGKDYIYSDTDSVKGLNSSSHIDYINKYNNWVINKNKKAALALKIDINKYMPVAPDGKERIIGIWEHDAEYQYFKTLGAKRYMFIKNSKLNLTVSGLNKKVCVPYLLSAFKSPLEVLEKFDDGLYIPSGSTGKMTHHYIDDERQGIIEDYQGVKAEFKEMSGIYLEDSDFTLNILSDYMDFINGVQKDFT